MMMMSVCTIDVVTNGCHNNVAEGIRLLRGSRRSKPLIRRRHRHFVVVPLTLPRLLVGGRMNAARGITGEKAGGPGKEAKKASK